MAEPILTRPAWVQIQENSQFLKDRHPYIAPPFSKEVDPQEVAIAYGRRQVDKLVGVLKLGDELPPEQCKQALQALFDCISSQESRALAIKSGVLPHLLSRTTDQDRVIRRLACILVARFITIQSGREAFARDDGLPNILAGLQDPIREVNHASAECLHNLSNSPDGSVFLRTNSDTAVPAVVQHVQRCRADGSSAAGMVSIETLVNLTRVGSGVEAVLQANGADVLLHCIRTDGPDGAHLEASARAVSQICQHPLGKKKVLQLDGLPAITALLGDAMRGRGAVQQLATAALMGLTLDEAAKVAIVETAGKRLAELVSCADQAVSQNALYTLQSAAEHPTAKEILQVRLDPATRLRVLGF
ncbi:hypothetical protein KFL_006300050 [Klebsormidium nitens]|uniref:ARM repeat superfamily protein n=1 Tax=Klebsormidium nitens TaxID=105231 RepID=A0A1Y1IP07_KLENI|nr:hypothetical protein KFL_006300050 [Klebsormidium nitens]|eukprot:GAQ90347.1 hypothetical protein KFL_006300050 [Klebsormidium nitens]